MPSMNRATLIGHLGRDPEIRTMQNGSRVANMTLATSESWKDKATGEKKERTEWHRVVVWNDALVGVCEKYLNKGSLILVEGQIQTRKWTDQSGVEKYSTEIVLQGFDGKIVMLGGKSEGGSADQPAHTTAAEARATGYDQSHSDLDDEIPF